MYKKLIGLTLIAAILMFGCLYLESTRKVSKRPIQNSLDATCVIIRDEFNAGTGTLLDSGYIITAKHVVDRNLNGKFDKLERYHLVSFDGGRQTCATEVVYFGELDFAILKPLGLFKRESSIAFTDCQYMVGDKVYTVGAMRGEQPVITDGYIGYPKGDNSRVTCFVAPGNSGGGIFLQNRLVGLVSMVAIKQVVSEFIIPIFEGDTIRGFYRGQSVGYTELNSLCIFVNAFEIAQEIEKKHIEILIRKPTESSFYDRVSGPWAAGLFRVIALELLFVGFLWNTRKYIFR